MIFVDHIVISHKFGNLENADVGPVRPLIPQLAGVRRLSFREPGDIDQNGEVQADTEVIGESQSAAWLHGSHETRLQLKSDGKTLLAAGNPGRFGRPENVFNLGFDETIAKLNAIVEAQGFPPNSFRPGELVDYSEQGIGNPLLVGRADEATEGRYDGSRVWGIHMTQNFITGSPENLRHVTNWLGTQSMRRVTMKRRGTSTLEFGAIGYCQTQMYDKAAELLAHCKSKEERSFIQGNMTEEEERQYIEGYTHPKSGINRTKKSEAEILALYAKRRAWKYAHENGLLRVEVKCAKDFLVHKGLTYLGAWNMGKVVEIFKERTELLERLSVEVDEMDVMRLPKAVRMLAAAWLAGVDVRAITPESTFFRKAAILKEYGLDVYKVRDLGVVRPIMKQIEIAPAQIPDWYQLHAA